MSIRREELREASSRSIETEPTAPRMSWRMSRKAGGDAGLLPAPSQPMPPHYVSGSNATDST